MEYYLQPIQGAVHQTFYTVTTAIAVADPEIGLALHSSHTHHHACGCPSDRHHVHLHSHTATKTTPHLTSHTSQAWGDTPYAYPSPARMRILACVLSRAESMVRTWTTNKKSSESRHNRQMSVASAMAVRLLPKPPSASASGSPFSCVLSLCTTDPDILPPKTVSITR